MTFNDELYKSGNSHLTDFIAMNVHEWVPAVKAAQKTIFRFRVA